LSPTCKEQHIIDMLDIVIAVTVLLVLLIVVALIIIAAVNSVKKDSAAFLKEGEDEDDLTRHSGGGLTRFNNSLAIKRYASLVREYGEPFLKHDRKGGLVVWRKPDYLYEIVLKDESIEHKPHCDFLYATVRVHIPDGALPAVLMLSRSIMYDRLKQLLTARSHSMGGSVATLVLGLIISQDEENKDKYYEGYGKLVKATTQGSKYEQLYEQLRRMVDANQKRYADKMPKMSCKI
jgi:hypothetical protein